MFRRVLNGKLYPPMAANPNGEAAPVSVWLGTDAVPVSANGKNDRLQVKAACSKCILATVRTVTFVKSTTLSSSSASILPMAAGNHSLVASCGQRWNIQLAKTISRNPNWNAEVITLLFGILQRINAARHETRHNNSCRYCLSCG